MRFTFAAASALALVPATAFAVDYLSVDQAAQQLFPDSERFETRDWVLNAEMLQQLAAMGVKPRSTRWSLRLAWRAEELLGVMVVDSVVGKFELITYAVGMGADGHLRGIEILSYRESHGHEIRMPAWRNQFAGKTQAAPIKVGEDIVNISGATLSCAHVTQGVKRIVAVLELARRNGVLSKNHG